MSEPITLFDPDGREVVVHGRGQANVLVAQGYTWTRPESGAPGVAVDAPPVEPPDSPAPPQSPAADDAPPPTGPRRKGRG